jgi:hypothetical protein
MIFGLQDLVGNDAANVPFVSNSDPSFDAAMNRIVRAFAQPHPTPPVVSCEGGYHWLVITDVVLQGTAVQTVFVNSPVPVIQGRKPPPEHQPLDTCGKTPLRGIANVALGLASWKTHFSTTTAKIPGTTSTKDFGFVTMTRQLPTAVPAPPPGGPPVAGYVAAPPPSKWPCSVPKRLQNKFVENMIDAYELRSRGPLAQAMRLVDGVGATVTVRDLRAPKSAYQLTTLLSGGRAVGAIALDGDDLVAAHAGFVKYPSISAADVRRILVDDAQAERIVVDAQLVWMPCQESVLPLQPFYHATYESQEWFVRIDGIVFPRLTPLDSPGRERSYTTEC